MKREEVKNKIPGITDEQLDWLMGENGRDVTAEKTKAAGLQTQVNDLTTQLNTAKDGLKAFEGVDVADLKGQITKLQGQLSEQADGFAFDSALDAAIHGAHGRDVKAIRGMLDVAALKASKDRTSDIKAAVEALAKEMLDSHFIKQGDLSQELVQTGAVGKIAGFAVYESNNMDFENANRVASKKTTTDFICGHPNWCHRVMEWQVPVHLQDLNGSGKYIGASAVQGRKVYGIKVSKPQTLFIKRTEAAT